jgi:thiol-disulfide isomerase/thioredoxin
MLSDKRPSGPARPNDPGRPAVADRDRKPAITNEASPRSARPNPTPDRDRKPAIPDAADPLSQAKTTTRAVGRRDPSDRRFATVCGAIAAPLLATLAWSVLDDPTPPVAARRLAATAAPVDAPVPSTPTIRPQAPAIAESLVVDPPRRLGRLTQLSLGALHGDGRLVPAALAPALGRRIAVLNVWATYCAPCMRELPRLLELVGERPWGNDLRLVPVLLEAPDRQNEAQQAALTALRASPASKQLLVDLTPAGALQTVLHEAGLLPERATLPLTLVLDCEQRLRWLHRGEITDTTGLAAVLEQLRAELPRCPAPTPEPALADGCGDDYCDPERAEDCATCPTDCACPENRECVPLAGRRARCNFRTQGLKD